MFYGYLNKARVLYTTDRIRYQKPSDFIPKALQLYEQEPGGVMNQARLGEYIIRWRRWVVGGFPLTVRDSFHTNVLMIFFELRYLLRHPHCTLSSTL